MPLMISVLCRVLVVVGMLIPIGVAGQGCADKITPTHFAVKTNLLYDATSTLNLGIEFGVAEKMTLDLSGNYNPWTLSDGRQFKHWLIQPEFRYWLGRRFAGHFIGIHGHYAQYNVSHIKMLGTEDSRHQGQLYGVGLAYGYQWILGRRWNLEAEIGLGYARLNYDRYDCRNCGKYIGKEDKNYFGPTKIGLSIVYLIW